MQNAQAKEIYVVDDDDVFTATVAAFLGTKGYSVREFYNVNDCIAALRKGKPNLIITDYNFTTGEDDQHSDGFRFYNWVKKVYGSIPFIVFSGQQDGGLVLKMVREGIRHYIMKDNDMFAELEESLQDIFKD